MSFDDGAALEVRYRPEVTALAPHPRSYGYRITSNVAGATVDAAQVSSGVGEKIGLPRALAALTCFLLADADRYNHAHRHGGVHPDGEPVTGVHEWAWQHASDLEALYLELCELPAGSVPAARLAPPQQQDRHGRPSARPADEPTRGEGPYRVAMVSVRSDHYTLVGAAGCFDLDQPPPAGLGQTFCAVEQAKRVVARDLSSLTVFWQFRILDVTGATVAAGFRAGPNGTGTTIRWQP